MKYLAFTLMLMAMPAALCAQALPPFAALDRDKSGGISQGEAYQYAGVLFAQLDQDLDGKLTVAEITAPNTEMDHAAADGYMAVNDNDYDLRLSAVEFAYDVPMLFRLGDTNQDGHIDMQEYNIGLARMASMNR